MLRLQTETAVANKHHSPGSDDRAVEAIAGEKLDTWFRGQDFEDASGSWMFHPRAERESSATAVQNEVVVVAIGEAPEVAHWSGLGEVEAGAVDRSDFTCGNQSSIHGRVMIGIQREHMIQNCAGA